MKNKISLLSMIVLAALLGVLAACTPGASAPEQGATDATQPAEVAQPETVTMYVGPELVECTGVAPQMCMLVRYSPEEEYTFFYNQIEGFTFEPGYEYELLVEVTPVENPPADGSSLSYRLVEVVSQTAVETAEVAQPETVTLFVGPELVECTGVAPQMCMLVKNSPEEEYTFFYNQIEGFAFEPGYEYELLVEVTQVENPPADGSSLSYRLVEVVNQTAVQSAAMTDKSSETAEAPVLEGPRWVLTGLLNGAGETVDALGDVEVTAVFKDGIVGGNASCNSYTGSYTVDGNSLTVGPIASTMMACLAEEISQQESEYLANLQAAATYAINGTQLQIANVDGVVTLTYEASTPISLTSVTWSAVNYNNGNQAVVSLIADTTITAVFSEDGTLSGSSGCNNYTTSYTVDGDAMTIGLVAGTMMMCAGPEGIMEQEMQYLNALPTTATYQIDGNTLTLRTADGAMVANYVVAEEMP